MTTGTKIYRDLQIHLDQQTLGFPATQAGADIQLLKQLFTPQQAEVATLLTYKYQTLDQIVQKGGKTGQSKEAIEQLLDESARKGVIGFKKKGRLKNYCTINYLVGMAEAGMMRPTPEFIAAHIAYMQESPFIKAFVSTKVPQMRTIPIAKSLQPSYVTGSYDEIEKIIQTTEDPIAILPCVCRSGADRRGEPCQQTSRKETCMAFRSGAKNLIETGKGRSINKEEALTIIRQNQADHLVLQPSNAQEPDFICSCCGCCCGILRMHKAFPNPVSFWATNFYTQVNPELCTGCGSCQEACQTGAMAVNATSAIAAVDLTRCLGCGLCVESCTTEALELRKKTTEIVPPRDGEKMMEIIMTNK